ncbi:Cu-Zn family superoxide dismutase [Saccharopolyspora erythraea NRRL 2338]|nr:Cu-Zn family superoxide dismutase [Saccharopolyspora erythraea NRRL 2338]
MNEMLHRTRALGSLAGLCATSALLVGCGSAENTQPPPAGQPSPQASAPIETTGTYEPYKQGAAAVTYDQAQVPPGATAKISSQRLGDGQTEIKIALTGLQPNRTYGAHVHTKPCGPTGEDAGPHFQQKLDPVQPSVDPAYANPQNEVWLDLHTDAQGNANPSAKGNWQFDSRTDANSFVIHQTHTHTEPGKAGTAGARLGCVTAKF